MTPARCIRKIIRVLTPDLLKPAYRFMASDSNPTAGHCYHAAEALYHLLGGKKKGWTPMRVRESDGMTHWWLRHSSGKIADPTADQYRTVGEEPPYHEGRAGGFLTKDPSARAKVIIQRIVAMQNP